MAPFEALYGQLCRTPLNWSEPGERFFFGPDLVKEAEEKVKLIQQHLKIAQHHQNVMQIREDDPCISKLAILCI
jgi:hypothetical protein